MTETVRIIEKMVRIFNNSVNTIDNSVRMMAKTVEITSRKVYTFGMFGFNIYLQSIKMNVMKKILGCVQLSV